MSLVDKFIALFQLCLHCFWDNRHARFFNGNWKSSILHKRSSLSIKTNCKLDGHIVWNAHNTVFGLKRSAICEQAVYLIHSMRPSVTWLNSLWWLAACNWVWSALSAVLSTSVGLCRKLGEVSCTECTGQGNDSELIPMVEMETRNPIERYLVVNFRRFVIVAVLWPPKVTRHLTSWYIFVFFFGKTTPYGKIFKILFWKFSFFHHDSDRRVVF